MSALKFLTAALGVGSKIMAKFDDPVRKHRRVVERRLRSRGDLSKAIKRGDIAAINKRIALSRISLRKYKAAD